MDFPTWNNLITLPCNVLDQIILDTVTDIFEILVSVVLVSSIPPSKSSYDESNSILMSFNETNRLLRMFSLYDLSSFYTNLLERRPDHFYISMAI